MGTDPFCHQIFGNGAALYYHSDWKDYASKLSKKN